MGVVLHGARLATGAVLGAYELLERIADGAVVGVGDIRFRMAS